MHGLRAALGILLLSGVLVGRAATAHSNGREARTARQCEKLLPAANEAELRRECIECVTRRTKAARRFHPENAAGERCR